MKYTTKSKTHNYALLIGLLGAVLAALPTFEIYLPPELYGLLTTSVGYGIYYFRNLTTQAIQDK